MPKHLVLTKDTEQAFNRARAKILNGSPHFKPYDNDILRYILKTFLRED